MGRECSICHKSHSFAGPSPLLHQNTRCLGKMFCYFCSSISRQTNAYYRNVLLWEVWHLHVPVVLGLQWQKLHLWMKELFKVVHATFYTGNLHWQKKLRTSKNFYQHVPLLHVNQAHSCCNKFSWSGARVWQAEHSKKPWSLLTKSFQTPVSDQTPLYGNMLEPKEAWPLKKTTKGMELVIKTRNSVNGTQISIGKFPPGKLFLEIFQWDEPKSRVLFTSQPEFLEFFGKWKTPRVSILAIFVSNRLHFVYGFCTLVLNWVCFSEEAIRLAQ